MRGEYTLSLGVVIPDVELPPHARRIRPKPISGCRKRGTTSACAENTIHQLTQDNTDGNYLRMRGEYNDESLAGTSAAELPPHARRIRTRSRTI